jgi:acyl carrier protein
MDNTTLTIFEKIRKFVSEYSGVKDTSILMTSELENDLKIYGDDSIDLINAYSKKFNVDISNFKFRDFIAPEGDTLLPLIANSISSRLEKKKRYDLKILDLVNGVNYGKLDQTIIGKQ